MASEDRIPSEEEMRKALEQVGVADVLLGTLTTIVSLGFYRVSSESRDLPQAKLAIETLRALEPVLREGGIDEPVVRDLEQARTNLQLAYAKAVAETPSEPPAGAEERPEEQSGAPQATDETPTGETPPE